MELLIGADPELFLKKNGQFFSAHGMIPGTKEKPHPVEKGAVQVDGLALEFNIDPAKTLEEFNVNIDTVLAQLRSMVPSDYEFDFSATAEFPKEHMEAQLPEALVLGCQPDIDAYSLQKNPTPPHGNLARAAGGHIHLGWGQGFDPIDPIHIKSCARLAKQLDWFVGVPSLILDTDNKRRYMYGRPGAFRPKTYGMEYRTLSNFWLKKPKYRNYVFNQCKRAFDYLIKGEELENNNPGLAQNVMYRGGAKTLMSQYKTLYEGFPG